MTMKASVHQTGSVDPREGQCRVISGSSLHQLGKLRTMLRLPTRHWMLRGWSRGGCLRPLAAHSLGFWTLWTGCGVGRSWLSVLRRVTPLPSSPYLCFPCKVWGLSKQTGGDKHMLWTVLCWVVSEVQQSRSLSGCGYTSHSE